MVVAIAAAALALGGGFTRSPCATEGEATRPKLLAAGRISTGDDESHPTLTADGSRLFFLKNTPDFQHWTIVVAERGPREWEPPQVAWFSGQFDDADVAFSADESTLYFVSKRPASEGLSPRPDTDLWHIRKTGRGDWGEPQRLAALSSEGNEWYPMPTASGAIYFGSERRPGNLGPQGTSDLWRARPDGGGFAEPENLGPAVNTAGNDIEAWVSPDERVMILASNGHADSRGAYDLYVSHHCDGAWSAPRNLDVVNSSGWDFSPRVTPNRRYLLFTSNRTPDDRPAGAPLDYDALLARIRSSGNGLRDIYWIEYSALDLAANCR